MVDCLYPGEIDNTPLQGPFGDEMKRGIIEGQDYTLIPTNVAMTLFEMYKGGPKFPRKVLNVGTQYDQIMRVNLFPIRIEMYFCDKYQPEPVKTENRFKRRYFIKNLPLSQVTDNFRGIFHLPEHTYTVRYWIKQAVSRRALSTTLHEARSLLVDVVNEWILVDNVLNSRMIQDILGEGEHISLLVEAASRSFEWPRDAYLKLQKSGDFLELVDAQQNCRRAKRKFESGTSNENEITDADQIFDDEQRERLYAQLEVLGRVTAEQYRQLQDSAQVIENQKQRIQLLQGEVSTVSSVSSLEEVRSLIQQQRTTITALEKQEAKLIRDLPNQKFCVICKEVEKSVVLLPCRHMCLCEACSRIEKLTTCPMCRKGIESRMNIFA